ncbi:MAG: HAD hydrolase family protein [Deltaproteobacteria bacterium]|nr:HAD hydrolase family protein [Deltaproteobacteria bacterium]
MPRGVKQPERHRPSPERLRALAGVVFDCDGVLTDGGLYYDDNGARLLRFDAKDGLGVALLCRSGVKVGVLSGRPTTVARRRFEELGVHAFVGQSHDKGEGLRALAETLGIEVAACAFVGDDLPDLPAFACAGLRVAVADAVPEVKAASDWITRAGGGRGAVREICQAILEARGAWPRGAKAARRRRTSR